jgi:uncharacterized protein (DUF362 family)
MKATKPLSRREFLRGLLWVSAGGVAEWLTGCTSPPASTATPIIKPTATATASPTLTPRPTSTPTTIADSPLFDKSSLTPVYVAHDSAGAGSYPAEPPFDPDTAYPESPYTLSTSASQNDAYRLVRETLRMLHPVGFGTVDWNPLDTLIQPGDRVLIKPNLVDASAWTDGQITHPAMLRPIIDYVYKACGPTGQIMVGDGPWSLDVFDSLAAVTGIKTLVERLAHDHGIPVFLQDLNQVDHEQTPLVDVGAASELRTAQRAWYDAHGEILEEGGDPGIGRYRISPPVLEADVVVSVPKAKVHCSGGITVAMKNLIGIIPAWNGDYGDGVLKDCAHTSDVDRAAGKRGMYLKNDTIWRTMADLNRILLYADTQGILRTQPQRRYLMIVDAIVAAEASQYNPSPYPLNTVILGTDPISVDAVTARCMGFDPHQLKSVVKAARGLDLPLGVADPARIDVHMADQGRLNSFFRRALSPELYVYSWEGHLEATDFDPPELMDWQWNSKNAQLNIAARDGTGTAWIRVNYDYQGEHRVKSLQLSEGSTQEGLWSVSFPLGENVRQVDVKLGDTLFNETEQRIEW